MSFTVMKIERARGEREKFLPSVPIREIQERKKKRTVAAMACLTRCFFDPPGSRIPRCSG